MRRSHIPADRAHRLEAVQPRTVSPGVSMRGIDNRMALFGFVDMGG